MEAAVRTLAQAHDNRVLATTKDNFSKDVDDEDDDVEDNSFARDHVRHQRDIVANPRDDTRRWELEFKVELP